MPTLANSNAATKLELKKIAFGTLMFTVGSGGMYSTLAAAIAAVNAQTRFVAAAVPSFVATSASTSGGTVDVRRLTSDGTNDLLNVRGKLLGVQVGSGVIFMGRCSNSDYIELFAPLHVDITSVTFNLYEITRACIFILPGTHLVDVPTAVIPTYTTISGIQGTCSITMGALQFLSHNSADGAGYSVNETFIDGVDINAYQYTAVSENNAAILYPAEGTSGWGTQTNFGMRRLTFRGGNTDGLFFSQNATATFGAGISGQFTLQDVRGYGQYDLMRGGQFRMLRITNCELYARASQGIDNEAIILGIGNNTAGALAVYPKQQVIIEGSVLDARNYVPGDNATETQCVDIRNPLPSNTTILIKNNTLIARDTVAANATGDATAVIVGAFVGGTNTPSIVVANNDIHVSNASAGTARLMHSSNANYVINRAGNRVFKHEGIAGVTTIGSNTAAATTY
jgi:hypothetical protein